MTEFEQINYNTNQNPIAEEKPSAMEPDFPIKPYRDPVATAEKSSVKASARIIGAAFLAMYGVVLILNIAILILSFIFSASGENKALELLYDPAVVQIQQILFSILAFTLPFILCFRLSGIRISNLICFSVPKPKTALPFFLLGVGFCGFANVVSSIASSVFDSADIGYEVNFPENPSGIFGFMLAFISTVIVPAFAEEFACRGLMLGLLKKYGEGFAIIVSSLLFGLMHGNFEQIPFAFLVGLILGFITVKSGTILIAIAVHGFNNFISVALDYFFVNVSTEIQNIGYTFFLTLCLLLGITAVFILSRNEGFYKLNTSKMQAQEGKKLVWFFTSAPIIIYAVLCLLGSLQYFVF